MYSGANHGSYGPPAPAEFPAGLPRSPHPETAAPSPVLFPTAKIQSPPADVLRASARAAPAVRASSPPRFLAAPQRPQRAVRTSALPPEPCLLRTRQHTADSIPPDRIHRRRTRPTDRRLEKLPVRLTATELHSSSRYPKHLQKYQRHKCRRP